jgi:hypothetical protein
MKRVLIIFAVLVLTAGLAAWGRNIYLRHIRQSYPMVWQAASYAEVTYNGSKRADCSVYESEAGDLLIRDETLIFVYFPKIKRHAEMVEDDFYISGQTVRSVAAPRIGMWAESMGGGHTPLIFNADGFEFESVGGVIVRVVINK